MWNTNERKGKVDQAKGRVKQAVGALTANEDLAAEGKADETVGKVEVAIGGVARAAAEAVAHIISPAKR
jgi:uncharacterized protein YjbJ (UPF0337 family)